jgi:hypothetical protein
MEVRASVFDVLEEASNSRRSLIGACEVREGGVQLDIVGATGEVRRYVTLIDGSNRRLDDVLA